MKLLPLTVLTILASSLLLFSTMNAYAFNCESTQTGFWDLPTTWINCGPTGVPGDNDNVTIKNGHIVTIRTDILTVPLEALSLTVEQSAELVLDGPSQGRLEIKFGTFTNFGKTTLDGVGGQTFSPELRLVVTPGTNECGGTIDVNGGSLVVTGRIVVNNELFVNKGTINLNGGGGEQSGSLVIVNAGGQVDNHGTINENPGGGLDSGIVKAFAGTFNDNLANLCLAVGGEILPIDTTMVLLGATQTTASWLIPVIVAGIGIGIVILRKY